MIRIKTTNLKTFTFLLIFLFSSSIAFSRLSGNWGECGYESGCPNGDDSSISTGQSSYGIKMYIIEGAGHFLNSYSSMMALMNKIELTEFYGIDSKGMRENVYNAIEEMERAVFSYEVLNYFTASTPYNMDFIGCLLNFDYDGHQKAMGLNPSIFENVRGFLSKGDINGVFAVFLKDSRRILDRLYEIKGVVEADKLPEISAVWNINQDYSTLLLFGQYSSSVFKAVLQTS